MDFDLEFWLLTATVVSGIIWLLYVMFNRGKSPEEEPILVEYARSFFPVLLAVLVLRSFVMEPFRIPSGSMLPTLEIGDFILVNKYAYGVRLPVLHTKILETGSPQRGDVVVFRYPVDPTKDYIKRLVGVPGDKVEWNNKTLKVNGVELNRTLAGDYVVADQRGSIKTTRLVEDLLGVKHDILVVPNTGGTSGSIEVPEGHYFMMGDNRDMSNDSRAWKLVPEANIVGKATYVWMHWNFSGDGVNFSRIGTSIDKN
ncbi:MAG TPA: signal peptidase I [Candidatus Thiothrix moscowensis]|uniref:signal peptidase I n=1 Tax=unclassified Thiothrix TaxID=2636184 RepID=UPI0025E70F1B|nr:MULTISPECIES: signal peptidase I [unclassified Thiothrix]HRJ52107.1 signal peptidase I [Candidatus Thiothrix moscowensis]HRJ92382.1 signal peptidase I [Candidatus Thiothrix moscowensis]